MAFSSQTAFRLTQFMKPIIIGNTLDTLLLHFLSKCIITLLKVAVLDDNFCAD